MKTSVTLSIVSALLITFTGCFLGPTGSDDDGTFTAQDGNAGTASLELNDMGDAAMELFGAVRGDRQDTINIDITIIPWKYDTTCKGWVREAQGTLDGGSVSRKDTVWFYDANSIPLMIPTMVTLSHYKHVRSVAGTYQNTFSYRYEMSVVIEKSATDTVFVFNNTINGEFNGDNVDNTVIKDVKRRLIHIPFRWLSYPFEGTISIDRPLHTVFITFGGTSTAQVTVTRKSDGKTWVFTINITTGEEYI